MKTITISEKELIMSLLKDHLISYKLVKGLERLGLDAMNYNLCLPETIFNLMSFGSSDKEERLFEDFLEWSERVFPIDLSIDDDRKLQELCTDIYLRLKHEQKFRKHKLG